MRLSSCHFTGIDDSLTRTFLTPVNIVAPKLTSEIKVSDWTLWMCGYRAVLSVESLLLSLG